VAGRLPGPSPRRSPRRIVRSSKLTEKGILRAPASAGVLIYLEAKDLFRNVKLTIWYGFNTLRHEVSGAEPRGTPKIA
jgi:hypothetical protein